MDTTVVGIYRRVIKVDLPEEYWNTSEEQGFLLKDKDIVFVPTNPRYSTKKVVQISGYALYPGTYAIRYEGEKLSELLKRAGGLREGAYLSGSVLLRKARNSLALFSNLSTDTAGVKVNNYDLVPIDFNNALTDTASRDNVELNPDDSVHISFLEDVVYVRGEVFVPTPILYKKRQVKVIISIRPAVSRMRPTKAKSLFFSPEGRNGNRISGHSPILIYCLGAWSSCLRKLKRKTKHCQS